MERRTPRFSRDNGGPGQDARPQGPFRAMGYQPDAMQRATMATLVVKSPRSYSAMRSALPRFRESGLRATDPELADALCKIECAPASWSCEHPALKPACTQTTRTPASAAASRRAWRSLRCGTRAHSAAELRGFRAQPGHAAAPRAHPPQHLLHHQLLPALCHIMAKPAIATPSRRKSSTRPCVTRP